MLCVLGKLIFITVMKREDKAAQENIYFSFDEKCGLIHRV